MRKFADFLIRKKWLVFLGLALISVFLISGFKYLWIDSDYAHSFPPDNPVVKLFNYAGEKFGSNYIAMIGLETDNIFNYKSLMRIKELTEKFKKIKGVSDVTSLINVMDIRKTPGGIEVADLFDTIPKSPKALKAKEKYILSKDMYRGKIVSADGTSTIIMVRIRDDANKEKIAKQIYKIVDNTPGKEKVYYSGFPLIMEYTARMIQSDMRRLVPITFLVIMIVLYFSFGLLRGVFIPLGVVFISTLWVFGLMGWVHRPISIISNALPVVLLATGTAYGIHFLNKVNEELAAGASKKEAIIRTFSTTGVPITMAALTTFIGFITMISASLLSVRDFGLFAAIGIIFSLLLTMILVPPIISILKKPKQRKHSGHAPKWIEVSLEKIGTFVLGHEKLILVLSLIIVIVSIIFLPKLSTDANMMNYYPESSPPRRAERFLDKKFGGSNPYDVFIRVKNGSVKNPFVLKNIYRLSKRLRVVKHSKNVQEIADLIAELNYNMNGVKGIPDTEDQVGQLWFFIEGKSTINQMVTPDDKEALLQGFIDNMETKAIAGVVDFIDNYLKKIPHAYYPITRGTVDKLNPIDREKILTWKLNDIKENFTLDVKYLNKSWYNGKLTLPPESFWGKVKVYLENPDKLPPNINNVLKQKIQKYLVGDEVVVVLPPKEREKVLTFLPLIIQGDIEKLTKTLQKAFPDQDPDDMSDMANSLIGLAQNTINSERVNYLLSFIPWHNKIKDEDLALFKGDLWDINDTQWGVPDKIYQTLTEKFKSTPVKLFEKQIGVSKIMEMTRRQLILNMTSSVLLAMLLVFIMLSIQLKSALGGLVSLSAITFTIFVNLLIMAIFKIPIDNATVLFGSIAVGIGIDYTIHFITRLKAEVREGKEVKDAIAETLATTGVGIFINTTTVALGFMVLLFSNMQPLKMLGILVGLTMFWSALGAITIYPAIILGFKLKFLKK